MGSDYEHAEKHKKKDKAKRNKALNGKYTQKKIRMIDALRENKNK